MHWWKALDVYSLEARYPCLGWSPSTLEPAPSSTGVQWLSTSPFSLSLACYRASLVAQMVKHLPALQETWVQSLGGEDPREKEMATHSSTLTWKSPWTEEPGRLQPMGLQRVGHDWVTSLHSHFIYSAEEMLTTLQSWMNYLEMQKIYTQLVKLKVKRCWKQAHNNSVIGIRKNK